MERPYLTRKSFAQFLYVFIGFLVILSIISLPIFSLCSRGIENQNRDLYQQTIAHRLEQADTQLHTLTEQLQYFCGNDANFFSLSNPAVKLDYLSLREFQLDLFNMLQGYSYIKDVVVITRNDLIITRNQSSPNRSMMTEMFFEEFFVTDTVRSLDDLRALGVSYSCLPIGDYQKNRYVALATCRPLFNDSAQTVAHALITVDLERLLSDIIPSEFSEVANVNVIYDNTLLYEVNSNPIKHPIAISAVGQYTDIQVEFTIPKNLLHQNIRSIQIAMWLLLGTAFLGGLALTVVFLFMTRRPMRRLTQAAYAIAPTIDAQDEYEYIEKTMTQLGRSMEQSQDEITQQRALLQQTILEKALMGGMTTQAEFDALLPNFPKRYQIALIHIMLPEDAQSVVDLALTEKLMLEHLLSDQFTQMPYFLHIATGTAALVLPEQAGGVYALEILRESFLTRYHLPVNIFLGDMVSGENMLAEAYASAKYIRGLAAAYIEKRVWHRGNFPEQVSLTNIDYTVFQSLYEALFNGSCDTALECLSRLQATLPSRNNSAAANRRTLEFAHSILIRVKQERFDLLADIPLPFPDLHQPLGSFLDCMRENIILLCGTISQDDTPMASFSQEIVDWINCNFTNPDLYLKTATTHFNINEKALQAAIHEVAGVSFAEYLENKRMNHAATLLLTTSLSVKEIAEKSGFALYNTFYKSFKRRYECSPLEYRSAGKDQ